jgi:hypothetical protein
MGVKQDSKYKIRDDGVSWQVEEKVNGMWSKQTNVGLAGRVKRGGAALTVCASCWRRRREDCQTDDVGGG